jgi:chromosome segregation ATPase
MNSKSNLIYALAAVTSLALGLGISFWRAATENHALMRANHATEMVLAATQDEAKTLREKLQRESKAREYAEAAQAVTREKLAQETKAHQAVEAARAQTASELQAANAKLASTGEALRISEEGRVKAETALQTANMQLSQAEEARQSIETAWQLAEYTVITVTAQLDDQISARKSAEDQVRLLNAKLTPETTANEKSGPIGPISAIEAPAIGAEERGPQTATEMSQLVPAASENRIIHVRKAGQPAEAIQ